jgi:putative adenylate-forming enzyme
MTVLTKRAATDAAAARAEAPELIARDRWSREQILELQRERLRELLQHVIARSPYYRDVFGRELPPDASIEQLPVLSKATLVDELDRIVTDTRLRRSELEEHLARTDAVEPFRERFRVLSTSGTTGLRALLVYTDEEFAVWNACLLRTLARIGIGPDTRVAPIGAPSLLHITGQQFAALRAGRAGAPALSVLTPLAELVERLNDYEPEALVGYASMMEILAEEQLSGRLRIDPRTVALGAEVLTDEGRERIEAAWNLRPQQVYAATEAPIIASGAPGSDAMCVSDDLLLLEVVDEHDRPVADGEPGFKVLVTNLVSRALPLIRYELSDCVTLATGDDPLGLPWRGIARVDGRSDDVLHLAGVDGRETAVHPYRLRAPFLRLPEVRQYQILFDGRRLEVLVVLHPAAGRDVPDRVRHALGAALAGAGAVPMPIDVVARETIEREPGHAAKLKLIKRVAREG